MSLNICVLSSGSTGNATLLWNSRAAVLVDCGVSRKYLEAALAEVGVDPSLLKGIVITHGHSDHLSAGAVYFSGLRRVPLYIHEDTFHGVRGKYSSARIAALREGLLFHHEREPFTVGEFHFEPFPTFHTCAGFSFGFRITAPDDRGVRHRVGFLTDTGKTDERMAEALANCSVLVLEANHDPEMVRTSTRHYLNKKWVLSDYGHLNNSDAGDTIARIRRISPEQSLKYVFVAHISKEHNTVQRAMEQIQERLRGHHAEEIMLFPTYHRQRSRLLTLP